MARNHRFETSAIPSRRGSGPIVLSRATAHLGNVGDRLTIMSYTAVDEHTAKRRKPRVIVRGENNPVLKTRGL
jgi:aspartate 1-decarboxylase